MNCENKILFCFIFLGELSEGESNELSGGNTAAISAVGVTANNIACSITTTTNSNSSTSSLSSNSNSSVTSTKRRCSAESSSDAPHTPPPTAKQPRKTVPG